MTTQKTFKRRVRARMAKTGESYTAARRVLIAAGDRPKPETFAFEPRVADERVAEATGRGYQAWFSMLDDWEAVSRPHGEIARWLMDEHRVPGWWAQTITGNYEYARGLRVPGRGPSGWYIGASKTVAVPIEELFNAFTDDARRERWLPGADLSLRTAQPPRTARYDWEDGSTRLVIGFTATGPAKSQVALQHERLPDRDAVEEMRAYWRDRLGALKDLLEGRSEGEGRRR
jgi:uncharacterized protein YndB with AHSA1/START domain